METISPLEKVTERALSSNNPFNTQFSPPMRNGRIISEMPDIEFDEEEDHQIDVAVEDSTETETTEKRKRGRPRTRPLPDPNAPKRKPGRPPKTPSPEPQVEPSQNIYLKEVEPVEVNQTVQMSRDQFGSPNYRAEWPGRDVFVGFHCNFDTNVATAFSLIALALDFGKDKIRFDYATDNDANEAKNQLVHLFLQTDASFLLLVGNDIVPAIGRAPYTRRKLNLPASVVDATINRHVLQRLIGSGKKLIGAPYFGKLAGSAVSCSHPQAAILTRQHADVVHPVDWVGSGMLLIHRNVLNDILSNDPSVRPNRPNAPFQFFSGDQNFCAKAKNAGHQAYCDFGIPVYSVGRQAFGGGTV